MLVRVGPRVKTDSLVRTLRLSASPQKPRHGPVGQTDIPPRKHREHERAIAAEKLCLIAPGVRHRCLGKSSGPVSEGASGLRLPRLDRQRIRDEFVETFLNIISARKMDARERKICEG